MELEDTKNKTPSDANVYDAIYISVIWLTMGWMVMSVTQCFSTSLGR